MRNANLRIMHSWSPNHVTGSLRVRVLVLYVNACCNMRSQAIHRYMSLSLVVDTIYLRKPIYIVTMYAILLK